MERIISVILLFSTFCLIMASRSDDSSLTFNGTSYADWIGQGGKDRGYSGGVIQGTVTSTTVYKSLWTGMNGESEGLVVYDASGTGTEQSQ